MIGVKIKCGLGNQLFQYAAGRALAETHKTDLVCYTDFYNQPGIKKHEDFLLPKFSSKIIEQSGFPPKLSFAQKIKNRLPCIEKTVLYKTASLSFDTSFYDLSMNTYLDGWFTSYKYFDTFSLLIKQELQLPEDLVGGSRWKSLADSRASIGLHVRRGDYVVPPHSGLYYELPPDYFRTAVKYLTKNETEKDMNILVFSDDILWCKENLQIAKATFVQHTGDCAALKDFELLSRCRYQVISNSTFAWWAAYLSKRQQGLVIAPRLYYKENNQKQTADRYPKDWMVL